MSYELAVDAVKGAVAEDSKSKGKWREAAGAVLQVWPDEAEFLKVKNQFCADAIVPAMRKELRDALTMNIPRKGTEEYNASPDTWDAAKKTRKDATATRDTLYRNLCNYAWPKEKAAPVPKELDVFCRERLEQIRNKVQKAEAAGFDAVKMLHHIEAALAMLN